MESEAPDRAGSARDATRPSPPPAYLNARASRHFEPDPQLQRCFWLLFAAACLTALSVRHLVLQAVYYGNVCSQLGAFAPLTALLVGVALGVLQSGDPARLGTSMAWCGLSLSLGALLPLALMPQVSWVLAALLLTLPVQAGFLTSLSVTTAQRYLLPSLELGLVRWWVSPLRLPLLGLSAGASILVADRTGITLFPTLAGLCWLWLSGNVPALEQLLPSTAEDPPRRDVWRWLAFAVVSSSVIFSLHVIPTEDKAAYGANILYRSPEGKAQDIVLTGRWHGAELFVDGRLLSGPLHGARYAEAVATHAIEGWNTKQATALGSPKTVLVIGSGSGILERALLERARITLTVVAPSADVATLTSTMPWLRDQTTSQPPAYQLTITDPIPWLRAQQQSYDAIVLDIPPPLGVVTGTYYTTYFLRLVRAHLSEQGHVILPALSPRSTPNAHARLRETAQAAGFNLDTHEVFWPGAGDFALFTLYPTYPTAERPANTPLTHDPLVAGPFAAEASTLQNLLILEEFTREYSFALGESQ